MKAGDPASEDALTILFVDDEPAITRAITRVLAARSGYHVLTAASGAEALDVLGAQSVDILVSDIDMPNMTGLELVSRARREFPSTLRVLLTGAGTMDRAINAINEGAVVRFLTKPFELDTFLRALDDLRDNVLTLRRERRADTQRARCAELFAWVESRYPGTLDFECSETGEVMIDVVRLRAFLESSPEARALAGGEPP